MMGNVFPNRMTFARENLDGVPPEMACGALGSTAVNAPNSASSLCSYLQFLQPRSENPWMWPLEVDFSWFHRKAATRLPLTREVFALLALC